MLNENEFVKLSALARAETERLARIVTESGLSEEDLLSVAAEIRENPDELADRIDFLSSPNPISTARTIAAFAAGKAFRKADSIPRRDDTDNVAADLAATVNRLRRETEKATVPDSFGYRSVLAPRYRLVARAYRIEAELADGSDRGRKLLSVARAFDRASDEAESTAEAIETNE